MAEAFTTSELLTNIKQRAMVPTSQSTFQNTDLLRFATDEIRSVMLPALLAEREEFYLTEVGATQSLAASTADYQMPSRAVGQILRDVVYLDANSNTTSLTHLDYEDVARLSITTPGEPEAFYLKNNKVVLVPTPSASSGSLKTPYFIRPSKLVETTSAAQISSIDSNNNQVTVSSLPSSITTSTPTDFVRAKGGFECLAIDQTPTNISSTTLTYSSLPTGLAVGDWIALAEETPIPQIPAELHPLLALRVARRVLKTLGDTAGVKLVEDDIKEMTEHAALMTTPRVHGEPKKVVARSWWR